MPTGKDEMKVFISSRDAVIAHVRHAETNYDKLLDRGDDRSDARHEVRDSVERVLAAWSQSPPRSQS